MKLFVNKNFTSIVVSQIEFWTPSLKIYLNKDIKLPRLSHKIVLGLNCIW